MARVIRSPRARADLTCIGAEVAERMNSLASANRELDAIHEKLRILARQPELGESRPELHAHVRCFPVGKYDYLIFYRPLDDGIEVVRVLHSSRDIPRIFRTGER